METAAVLSKKALMRPLGTHNPNPRAAEMEKLLEEGINKIGLGPQGMTGSASVLGVHIENTALCTLLFLQFLKSTPKFVGSLGRAG